MCEYWLFFGLLVVHAIFYKQQGLSNESLDCENVKQRESRFETKMAKLSNKKIISKQENE